MVQAGDLVFLIDVDNTLLDNDAVLVDLHAHLREVFGEAAQQRYWDIFEQLRTELGYADYLGALQRYRLEHQRDPEILALSLFLLDYPFEKRLFPHALEVLHHLQTMGTTVILSDGDVVFQPRKVQRSGIWDAVDGKVLIYVHKEQMLEDVAVRYPAQHYVLIDDKLHILTAMKHLWGQRLTTVFPKQGHYAYDPDILSHNPPADIAIDRIGDLLGFDIKAFRKSV
jgi:FMN phosphatase YigB (HAD superfamily)